MIPVIGEPIVAGQRYRMRPGAYAVILSEGQILLTHQAQPVPEFQLPGGGIDPGEQTLPALHREVMEETGWTMRPLRRMGAFRRFTYMPEYDLWAEKLCTIYLARPGRCIAPPSEEGHVAVWMPVTAALSALANDGDRLYLSRCLKLSM